MKALQRKLRFSSVCLSLVPLISALTGIAIATGAITLSKGMTVVIAALLAIAGAIPLCVIVTWADKRRMAVVALHKVREQGLITQEEFELRKHEILNRSWWYV